MCRMIKRDWALLRIILLLRQGAIKAIQFFLEETKRYTKNTIEIQQNIRGIELLNYNKKEKEKRKDYDYNKNRIQKEQKYNRNIIEIEQKQNSKRKQNWKGIEENSAII